MTHARATDRSRGKSTPSRTRSAQTIAAREPPDGKPVYMMWILGGGVIFASLVWCYWSTIRGLMGDWRNDPNYSVGQLVPLVAVYLAWHDRAKLNDTDRAPCWWGLALIVLAQCARIFGLLFLFESAERYALVLTVIGVVLFLAGRHVAWKMRWILLFLFLMVPLPGRVHNAISGPLQSAATSGAVVSLELLGVHVTREGNVMVLNDRVPVAVAEACSGLRMLTAFVVVAAAFAFLVNRSRWQNVLLVFSAIPVAIVCNLLRLVATSLLFLWVSGDVAQSFFHDFAGWTMMPAAIGMLAGVLWVSSRLVEAEPEKGESKARAEGGSPSKG